MSGPIPVVSAAWAVAWRRAARKRRAVESGGERTLSGSEAVESEEGAGGPASEDDWQPATRRDVATRATPRRAQRDMEGGA
jgi:hypothetical protein